MLSGAHVRAGNSEIEQRMESPHAPGALAAPGAFQNFRNADRRVPELLTNR
jgi:hypothetical protein